MTKYWSGPSFGNYSIQRSRNPTYTSILGVNLLALWHAQMGVTTVSGAVSAWVDQVGGLTLTSPTVGRRPLYAADGSLFGGKSVVQTDVANNRCTFVGGATNFLALGTRPWFFQRSRVRTSTTGGRSTNIGTLADSFFATTESATNFTLGTTFTGTTVGPLKDTSVHSRSFGLDGTNQVLTVDNTSYTLAAAGGIGGPTAINRIAMGCEAWSVDGVTGNTNASIAFYAICLTKPTDAQIAEVMALMAYDFP